jgi:alpha-beta hydrolase superfamily lysophospholipase
VLTAPLLGLSLKVPAWKLWLGRGLRWLVPTTRFRTGLDPHNMTRDPEFLARRRADPLLQKHVSIRWFYALQRELARVWAEAGAIRCPVLLLVGTADRTIDPAACREWLARTSAAPAEFVERPGGVHELLNDRDWDAVHQLIWEWVERQTSAD